MKISSKIIIFSLIITFFPFISSAQIPDSDIQKENLGITISPKYPTAFEPTTIKIQNYSTDLLRADVSWSLNGTVVKKGIGEKSFTFTPGDLGSVNRISIVVLTSEGRTITDSATIIPANVDLLWQAESYTPPLYKGKALYTGEGKITIVAIPELIKTDGSKYDAKNLVYSWKKDKKILQGSGYGKNFITLESSVLPGSVDVSVEVSSLDNSIIGTKSISLSPDMPKILFYENNPLLGILYEKNIPKRFTLIGKEMILSVIPYFFSVDKKDSGLNYLWSLNSKPITERGSDITLRLDTSLSGVASVGVEIKNISKIFQFAGNSLLVDFGENVR